MEAPGKKAVMERRTLGRTGLTVAAVGLGGIPIQRIGLDEAAAVVRACLDAGVDFIDTARGYSDSERKIGLALSERGRREGVVLATKSLCRDRGSMAADIDRSLEDLRTDHIDVYQLHNVQSPDVLRQVLAPGGAMDALEAALRDGRVRHIGVTGHHVDVLCDALATGRFETVQYPHNNVDTACEDKLIPLARRQGAGRIGMKPAGGGALSDVPLTLRYVLSRGTDVAIPGIDRREQIAADVGAAAPVVAPDEGELERLRAEARDLGSSFCRRCGYCLPCPEGLNIPFLIQMATYSTRYGLHDWAAGRVKQLPKVYSDCNDCGECEERCPYDLPTRELLKKAGKVFRTEIPSCR